MITRLGTLAWLLLVWVVLMQSLTLGSVLAGLAVCSAIVAVFRFEVSSADPVRVRPVQLVRFAAYFVVKLIQANVQVAWAVLRVGSRPSHGIVAVPVAATDTLLTLLANAISLTPGTSIIEVRADPPTLYVHALELHSVSQTRLDILNMELRLMRALGSTASIAQVEAQIAQLRDAPADTSAASGPEASP